MDFLNNVKENEEILDKELAIDQSFDIIKRNITVAGIPCAIYYIDGFLKDEVMEKVFEFLLNKKEDSTISVSTATDFIKTFMPYPETETKKSIEEGILSVLSGATLLIADKISEGIVVDARTYPVRSVEEPEKDKVLRGSRDGFVETLVFNTSLIRRRIRDRALTMEIFSVGELSSTDVVISYMKGKADEKMLAIVREKIKSLNVKAITMCQESLAEAFTNNKMLNPFPKIRFTERPDAAAASLLEGKILVITDNSPSVMILPSFFFEFWQETDDYYFPPLTGTYFKISRVLIFLLTIFLTPVILLLLENPELIPSWLSFIRIEESYEVPLFLQFLVLEFAIDGLRLASLNTPSTLSSSLGTVAALILGEFAIKSGWFVSQTILYMAFVAITNYAQPSFELGYAFKFMRIMLLILVQFLGIWGFIAGVIILFLLLLFNKTLSGECYLYPLIPFEWKAFKKIFIRKKLNG